MNLYETTTQVHHDAEMHPFGARMARGEITRQEWANWLWAMIQVHRSLDPYLPPFLQRGGELLLDAARTLPVDPLHSYSAGAFEQSLTSPLRIAGAAYVFCGAHLRGGAVIRKRLEPKGFACSHLRFNDARAANQWLVDLREAEHAAPGALIAFEAVIGIMNEVQRS